MSNERGANWQSVRTLDVFRPIDRNGKLEQLRRAAGRCHGYERQAVAAELTGGAQIRFRGAVLKMRVRVRLRTGLRDQQGQREQQVDDKFGTRIQTRLPVGGWARFEARNPTSRMITGSGSAGKLSRDFPDADIVKKKQEFDWQRRVQSVE